MASKRKLNELTINRIYDAPVKAVWDAWTDPKQVAQWWGPRGFTITTHSKDLRPGGHWAYTMHGPDGTNWENKTIYHEVEKYQRLVYDHGGNDDRPPLFRVTVNFTDVKGKTKMEMTMALPTAEAAEQTRKFVKSAGGDGTWDRLGEFLEKDKTGKEKFFINRTFHTDPATMYDMWTNPKHFSQWLAPKGANMEFIKADIRPGGVGFFAMKFDAGLKMFGQIHYKELQRTDRIVYTQNFCDENQSITRHPMVPTWPETMHTTITIVAEDDEHTRVTVLWEPMGNVSAEEMKTFINERAGMTQGWTGSFDKLEEYLESAE